MFKGQDYRSEFKFTGERCAKMVDVSLSEGFLVKACMINVL